MFKNLWIITAIFMAISGFAHTNEHPKAAQDHAIKHQVKVKKVNVKKKPTKPEAMKKH